MSGEVKHTPGPLIVPAEMWVDDGDAETGHSFRVPIYKEMGAGREVMGFAVSENLEEAQANATLWGKSPDLLADRNRMRALLISNMDVLEIIGGTPPEARKVENGMDWTKLSNKQLTILDCAPQRTVTGLYCGDSRDMQGLVSDGLMEPVGRKSGVRDESFRITGKGCAVLCDSYQALKQPKKSMT